MSDPTGIKKSSPARWAKKENPKLIKNENTKNYSHIAICTKHFAPAMDQAICSSLIFASSTPHGQFLVIEDTNEVLPSPFLIVFYFPEKPNILNYDT